MKYKLKKPKMRRHINHWWFAWYPVLVEKDRDGDKYLIWLENVWKAYTLDIVTYHI
jgi:hypothetical protein